MTPAKQALAEGFAVTLSVHGHTWTRTSDAASIVGTSTRLEKESVHMEGSQDREFPVLVADLDLSPVVPATQCMPAGDLRLKRGDELTKNVNGTTKYYRVTRADYSESTGLWTVMLVSSF